MGEASKPPLPRRASEDQGAAAAAAGGGGWGGGLGGDRMGLGQVGTGRDGRGHGHLAFPWKRGIKWAVCVCVWTVSSDSWILLDWSAT